MKFLALSFFLIGLSLSNATHASVRLVTGSQYYMTWTVAAQVVTFLGKENDSYIFRYETGPYAGRMGSAHMADLFASMSGCAAKGYCVGDRFAIADRQFAEATIVGIEYNGRFVLRFDTGDFAGKTGSNWAREQLFSLKYRQ